MEADEEPFGMVHTGDNFDDGEAQTWICRVVLNKDNELSLVNRKESVLLHNEYACSLLEYMPDKIIITLHPKSLLIVEHWQEVRTIQECGGEEVVGG